MPPSTVQLIYRTDHEVGKLLVSHPKIGATGYTGSRGAGLVLKDAADKAGKPAYMELSSINPVYILTGALRERSEEIAEEFATSCLMGVGQFWDKSWNCCACCREGDGTIYRFCQCQILGGSCWNVVNRKR